MNYLFKKTALILMLCLPLFCTTVYGQTAFQTGYTIDYEGDTLRGLLKEQFAEVGYNIHFKRTETSEVEIKGTGDIQKYYLGFGHLYETHQLEHEGESVTLFLKCLILGDVSLYGYTNDQLRQYYYVKTDELGFRELKYGKEILYDEKKGSYMKNHNRYIGILKLTTAACPDLAPRIDKLKFSERGVIEILRDYHYCINRDFIEMTSAEKRKGKLGLSVLAGPNFIVTRNEDIAGFKGKTGFDVGGYIEYIIPNSRDRYGAELGYLLSRIYLEEDTGNLYALDINQIPIMMNVYAGDEKDRFSFKAGYYASVFRPSVILGNSLAVGLGYDRKIGKIRLITNVEYRWGRLKTIGLHAGIGF